MLDFNKESFKEVAEIVTRPGIIRCIEGLSIVYDGEFHLRDWTKNKEMLEVYRIFKHSEVRDVEELEGRCRQFVSWFFEENEELRNKFIPNNMSTYMSPRVWDMQ